MAEAIEECQNLKKLHFFKNKRTGVSNLLIFSPMTSSSEELITQQIISEV